MSFRITIIFALVLLAISSGCGGSDSYNDDSDADVGGLWKGWVSFSEDECRTNPFGQGFEFVHSVMQFYDDVEMQDSEGRLYVGDVLSGDGFSVDAPGPQNVAVSDRLSCDVTYRFRYDSINGSDDRTAEVKFMVIEECSDGSSCESVYNGKAKRE